MNFVGSAAFWSQSVESILQRCSWSDLCTTICSRFERDQQNSLNRQFFRLKQTATAAEYIEKFDELINQILAHDPCFSPHVITSRFVDGLKDEIRAVVLVHRPSSMDAACSLALLQEEVLSDSSSIESPSGGGHSGFRARSSRTQWSAPNTSRAQATVPNTIPAKPVETAKPSGVEEKLQNVKNYRRAKGLCFKCGDKWNPNHKCSTTVSLNLVEELWQLIDNSDDQDQHNSNSGEDLMQLSLLAVQGTDAVQTVRLVGDLFQHSVVILLDSESSSSFISQSLADKLPNWTPLTTPVQIRVANDTLLQCTHEIQHCPVNIQGHCFLVNLKILPLQCYDIILGIDWLEQYSPMEVHWKNKMLSFEYKGHPIQLIGVQPNLHHCPLITAPEVIYLQAHDQLWCIFEVFQLEPQQISSSWPADLHNIIVQYQHLFDKPSGVPPKRHINHTIPLITGAQPFRLRPYRYNPAQKDEIEKQVQELL